MHELLNQAELVEKYGEPSLRAKIVDLLDLRSFLQECIIRSDYKVPDGLNDALHVSEYGSWLINRSVKVSRGPNAKIHPKVARLTCLLELYHLDFLVDVEATDVSALAGAISNELLAGHILLPFVHGPELYERAAALFPDQQPWLSTAETLKLLDGQPIGVFQMGRWLSGPFGLIEVQWARDIRPTLRVPLQHCHDVSCRSVHFTQLSTDSTAQINDSRSDIAKLLVAECEEPSEFAPFFAELAEDQTDEYDDTSIAGLGYLIADAFSDSELAMLLVGLIEADGFQMRAKISAVSRQFKSPQTFVEGMCRAELLQLMLLATDPQIASVIDASVFAGTLVLPEEEVRRPVLRNVHSSAFGNVPELSSLGLRNASRQQIGPLRLRRLVERIFLPGADSEGVQPQSVDDMEELSWQLREVKGVNVEARLDGTFERRAQMKSSVA